jgi:WD40 repeat protein
MDYNSSSANITTKKFLVLNFNLKKIIFSFLALEDQRSIYWLNKKLRELLPDSALKINVNRLSKCSFYQYDSYTCGILEIQEGAISCFTTEGIKLFKIVKPGIEYSEREHLELTRSFPLKIHNYTFPIKQGNGNIVYRSDPSELTISDGKFNLIQNFKESDLICSLCNISDVSFALGLANGSVKIYTRNQSSYEVTEYNHHSNGVYILLYLPKQNFLLTGACDKVINVLSLTEGKLIKRLTGHCNGLSSFLSLSDDTFASASFGVIKIWSMKNAKTDESIECVRTIRAHENSETGIFLHRLGNDLFLSRSYNNEFIIWDIKTYECLKIYKEDSPIFRLIVTNDNKIINSTKDRVNLWVVSM